MDSNSPAIFFLTIVFLSSLDVAESDFFFFICRAFVGKAKQSKEVGFPFCLKGAEFFNHPDPFQAGTPDS